MSTAMQELAAARKKYNQFKMKCIVPDKQGSLCGKKSIRSHSIQHNGILSQIAESGIVYCLSETTKDNEIFEYNLKDQGITKQASIFECLCKEHDDVLFADIEKRHFAEEPKQCFQFAFKALLHTYWSKCNDARITGKFKPNVQIARQIEEDKKAYSNELNRFWEILHSEQYCNLLCRIFVVNKEIGAAISTSINVCRKFDGTLFGIENEGYPLLHISAFPAEGKSYLLISSLKENEAYFRAFTSQLTLLTAETILKRFNILLPLLAENIMLSPRVVNKMTEADKNQLLMIFRIETMSLYYQYGIDINHWSEQVSYSIWG